MKGVSNGMSKIDINVSEKPTTPPKYMNEILAQLVRLAEDGYRVRQWQELVALVKSSDLVDATKKEFISLADKLLKDNNNAMLSIANMMIKYNTADNIEAEDDEEE